MIESTTLKEKLSSLIEEVDGKVGIYSYLLNGGLHFSYPGIRLSLRNLCRLMLEYSDNTASDLILRLAECMYRCKTGNGRIRALLPHNTGIANITKLLFDNII